MADEWYRAWRAHPRVRPTATSRLMRTFMTLLATAFLAVLIAGPFF